MNSPKDQIWNLLQTSGILSYEQLEHARLEYSNESAEESSVDVASRREDYERLLDWLLENKLISQLHREIMGAGSAGPFNYGDYLLLEKLADNDGQHASVNFLARHTRTGHPVKLCFFSGSSPSDSKRWQLAHDWAERRRGIDSACLFAIFQPVVLPTHRYIVLENPSGISFLEKVPLKTRMPWEKACEVAGFIASALASLHSRKIYHEKLWPGNIFFQAGGAATVLMDLNSSLSHASVAHIDTHASDPDNSTNSDSPNHYLTDDALDDQADWYSLGCILYRLVSGKLPKWDDDDEDRKKRIAVLRKLEVPKTVLKLISRLTSTSFEQPITSHAVLKQLKELTGRKTFDAPAEWRSDSHRELVKLIGRELPLSELPILGPEPVAQVNSIKPIHGFDPSSMDNRDHSINREVQGGQLESERKANSPRRKKNLVNMAFAVGTGVLACLLGAFFFLWTMGDLATDPPRNTVEQADGKLDNSSKTATENANANQGDQVDPPPAGWLVQSLVEDDDSLLWESPTAGISVDWNGVPAAPDFVFVIRPSELLDSPSGELALRGLGTEFDRVLSVWQANAGVELAEVEQLIISLHNDGGSTYVYNFVVRLIEPQNSHDLAQKWGARIEEENQNADGTFYSGDDYGFVANVQENKIDWFVMADDSFIRSSIERGTAAMGGAMGRLAKRCDAARHFNWFFIPRILSNEQSQQLFSGDLEKLRQPLLLFFDDRLNGTLLSLHVDRECYWEMQFDRSPDIRADEFETQLDERLGETRQALNDYVSSLPDDRYWLDLKRRFPTMLQFVYSNSRVGIERGEVIANGWLPASSLHNLTAATEITLAAAPGNSPSVVRDKPPQNLQELLDRNRNLKVTSSPDLVNLLRDLQAEIKDDFPDLPFEFEIRLMGADLSVEGITQNQRPSDINLPDNSLSEILTEICFKANPDKNATGPSDELCTLLWVSEDDPKRPGHQIVMITTRKSAIANGYRIPEAFRSE